MNKPEIDWGDGAPKARSWESDEARRVRQAKHARELEWEAALRKRARVRLFIVVPMTLILIAAGTGAGLDYSGVLSLGIFDRSTPVHVADPPPIPPAPPAVVEHAPPVPVVPVVAAEPEPAEPIALAAELTPMDPALAAKLKNRLEHARNGIGVISRERVERLAMLAQEDQLLRGSYAPDAAHRRHDSLYDQNRRNAQVALGLRGDAYARQLTLIQNVQWQIQDTVNHEAHDVEALASLNARLAKAQAEADALAKELEPTASTATPLSASPSPRP